MQTKKSKQLFVITLVNGIGTTKTVKVRATTREVAERRALKRSGSDQWQVKHDA